MPFFPHRPPTPYPGQTRGNNESTKNTSTASSSSSSTTTTTTTTTKTTMTPFTRSDFLLSELDLRLKRLLTTRGPVREAARLAARKSRSVRHNTTTSKTQVSARRAVERLWPEDPLWGCESSGRALPGSGRAVEGVEKETGDDEGEKKQQQQQQQQKRVAFSKENLLDNWRLLKGMEREKSLGYVTVGRARLREVQRELLEKAFGRFEGSLCANQRRKRRDGGEERGVVEELCLKRLRSEVGELREGEDGSSSDESEEDDEDDEDDEGEWEDVDSE